MAPEAIEYLKSVSFFTCSLFLMCAYYVIFYSDLIGMMNLLLTQLTEGRGILFLLNNS